MALYSTLTNRKLDLSGLSTDERSFLTEVLERYRSEPDWSEFSSFWVKLGTERVWKGKPRRDVTRSSLWRLCQDLESRLGIRQGQVGWPDYRDSLIDLIEERYGSRYRFCKELGVDEGFLSRVLNGHKDFSLATLLSLLQKMGLMIRFEDQDVVLEAQQKALEELSQPLRDS